VLLVSEKVGFSVRKDIMNVILAQQHFFGNIPRGANKPTTIQ
jgi:hypothetical protein